MVTFCVFDACSPAEFTAEPGTQEAHDFLWNYDSCTLELTHNHGSENEDGYVYHNSNDKIEVEGEDDGDGVMVTVTAMVTMVLVVFEDMAEVLMLPCRDGGSLECMGLRQKWCKEW